jgi:transposase
LLWSVTAAAGVLADADGAGALSVGGASALEVIDRQSARIDELTRQNTELRELVAGQADQLAEANATIAVLQRMVFGRSSEKSGPAPDGGSDDDAGAGDGGQKKKQVKRGPGARSGRRGYPGLPRFEVFWDFPGGGYCCPECGEPFTLLGDHWSGEQLDWQVHPAGRELPAALQKRVPVPGAADGDGAGAAEGGREGPVHERVHRDAAYGAVRGRAVPEFPGHRAGPAGGGDLARDAGRDGRAGGKAAGPAVGRDRGAEPDSWLLHAGETTWRVFAPGDGEGPAKFWLWVFIGADTVCFVMDPSRSGKVLARHAGTGEETGQLLPGADGEPRRLVISSDFYAVYQSAGRKAGGLVNLYCWSHLRRYFVRAGDANPEQLSSCAAGPVHGWTGSGIFTLPMTSSWPHGRRPRPRPPGENRPPRGWRRRTRHGTPRSP